MAPASYVTLVLLSFLLRDRFSVSGRPRWSIGRATASVFAPIADLEPRLDFGERVEREMCHADSRPRVPSTLAERRSHEIRRAVHRLRQIVKARFHIERAAKSHDLDDPV